MYFVQNIYILFKCKYVFYIFYFKILGILYLIKLFNTKEIYFKILIINKDLYIIISILHKLIKGLKE